MEGGKLKVSTANNQDKVESAINEIGFNIINKSDNVGDFKLTEYIVGA